MSETAERKWVFQDEVTWEMAEKFDKMMRRTHFTPRRVISMSMLPVYTLLCVGYCGWFYLKFRMWHWIYLFMAVCVLGVWLAAWRQHKRTQKINRVRFEEAWPDGTRPVTWWVSGDRLYNDSRLRENGLPLKNATHFYARGDMATLVTSSSQYHGFERKALPDADWTALCE